MANQLRETFPSVGVPVDFIYWVPTLLVTLASEGLGWDSEGFGWDSEGLGWDPLY